MSDDLLNQDEALDELTPHLPAIARCPDHAWRHWEELRADKPAIFAELSRRTRASFIFDGSIAQAKREFPGIEGGPRLVQGNGGLMLLEISDRLRLRFKRMRPNLTTSSIMTAQQLQLQMQLPIPGMAPATTATVGYMTNAIETGIDRKVIVCRRDAIVLWVIELPDELGESLPTTLRPQSPRDPRIGPAEATIEIASANTPTTEPR